MSRYHAVPHSITTFEGSSDCILISVDADFQTTLQFGGRLLADVANALLPARYSLTAREDLLCCRACLLYVGARYNQIKILSWPIRASGMLAPSSLRSGCKRVENIDLVPRTCTVRDCESDAIQRSGFDAVNPRRDLNTMNTQCRKLNNDP